MKVTNRINTLIKDLKNGKVVCFKTDTIWGLSANPYNKEAMLNLYKIKQRDLTKPFIFLAKETENIENYTNSLTNAQQCLIQKLWPGPISIVFDFNKNSNLLNFYTNKETIAIRKPKNTICQTILNKIDFPLPSTSVNIENSEPINNLNDIKDFLKNEDVTILSSCNYNKRINASTLIKFEDDKPKILRKGNLTKKILDSLEI